MEVVSFNSQIFATIVGGVLAILGGIISSLVLQRNISRREKHIVTIKKTEELYKIILKLDHFIDWVGLTVKEKMEGDPPLEVRLRQFEYNEIEMLVGLYFCKHQAIFKAYLNRYKVVLKEYIRFMLKFENEKMLPTNEQLDEIDNYIKNYKEISEDVKMLLIEY